MTNCNDARGRTGVGAPWPAPRAPEGWRLGPSDDVGAGLRGPHRYDAAVRPPETTAGGSDDWIGLSDQPLPVGDAHDWAVLPGCGAVVLFSGTVRDHADGRSGVSTLTYEAYEDQALARMGQLAAEIRTRWPMTGRVVLLHRVGPLALTDVAVIVAVSTPHRPEAFEAAKFGIDELKATVPIWKHEVWEEGAGWGTEALDVRSPARSAPTAER